MNRKTLAILILAVAAIGIFVAVLLDNSGTRKVVSDEVFTEFNFDDTASVTRIEIREMVLSRTVVIDRSSGTWLADDKYAIRKDLIDLILNTFKTIRFQNHVPKNAQENVLKNLASGSKEVKIFLNGEHRYTWYVGSPTMDHNGTYMLLERLNGNTWEKSREPVIMGALRFKGELNTRFTSDVLEWRHTGIFNLHPSAIAQITVNYPEPYQPGFSIAISEDGVFSLSDDNGKSVARPDTVAMRKYAVQFKKVHFETFNRKYTPERMDSLRATPAHFTITVTDRSGNKRSVKAWRIKRPPGSTDVTGNPIEFDPDRMHAFVDGEMVVIQYYVFDPLMRTLPDFTKDSGAVENNPAAVNNPVP
jgi:hypothetical protein